MTVLLKGGGRWLVLYFDSTGREMPSEPKKCSLTLAGRRNPPLLFFFLSVFYFFKASATPDTCHLSVCPGSQANISTQQARGAVLLINSISDGSVLTHTNSPAALSPACCPLRRALAFGPVVFTLLLNTTCDFPHLLRNL